MKKIIVAVLLLTFVACSPVIKVYTDYDPDYDLWEYHTFNWIQNANIESGNNPLYYNELNDKRIKSAVQEQLARRGYSLTDDKPDLIFHYHIIVDDKRVVNSIPCGDYYPPFWITMRTNTYQYREGTLILDLMDTKTNHLVWRGWAVSSLYLLYTPDEIDRLIKTSVEKMFRRFPAVKHPHPTKDIVSN